jgi:hypothetical protein
MCSLSLSLKLSLKLSQTLSLSNSLSLLFANVSCGGASPSFFTVCTSVCDDDDDDDDDDEQLLQADRIASTPSIHAPNGQRLE